MSGNDTFTGISLIINSITELVALEKKISQEIQSFVQQYKNMIPPQIQQQIHPRIYRDLLMWHISIIKTPSKNPLKVMDIPPWLLYIFNLDGHYKTLLSLVKRQNLLNTAKEDIGAALSSIQNRLIKFIATDPLDNSTSRKSGVAPLRELTPEELKKLLLSVEFALVHQAITLEKKYHLTAPRELFARLKLMLYLEEKIKLLPVWYLHWHVYTNRPRVWTWIKYLNLDCLPKLFRSYKDFLTPFIRSARDYNKKRYLTYHLLKSIYHRATEVLRTYRTCFFSQKETR